MHAIIKKIRYYLRPIKRISWEIWCTYFAIPYARINYQRIVGRCVNCIKNGNPIRVVFLINEITKWKMQRVLDLMIDDKRFEPIIAFTIADIDWRQNKEIIRKKHQALHEYFLQHKVRAVELADVEKMKVRSPKSLKPDIVFYQQPWDYAVAQHPIVVSRYALTCYVPYYVPNAESLQFDCDALVQRSFYRYYTLNEAWSNAYQGYLSDKHRAGDYVCTGHPMLDQYSNDNYSCDNDDLIIFAPHWSITYPGFMNSECYSTFMNTGRWLLNWAREHQELNWVFRPHPNLEHALISSGAWTQKEVDEYFSEWEKIGKVSTIDDYVELFKKSRALITDCGSFLSEYSATGRPLIRLISSTCKMKTPKWNTGLFNSFYNCHNVEELEKTLVDVVINNHDAKHIEHIECARASGLLDSDASGLILNDILKVFNK